MTSTEPSPKGGTSHVPKFFAIAFGLALTAAMILVVANSWFQAATEQSNPIEQFPAALQRHGLTGQAPLLSAGAVTIAHEMTYEVTIDDKPVWLVYFDPFDAAQAEAWKKVKHDQSIELDGRSQAAVVHGAVALVGSKGHPEEKKLLAAFADFQTPGSDPPGN